MFFRDLGNFRNRRTIAVHGIDRLEHDDFWPIMRIQREQLFQMSDVVVTEHVPVGRDSPDTVDDGGVIQFVTEHHAVRELPEQALKGGIIGAKTGREDQRRLLAMPFGDASLKLTEKIMRTTDVARPTGTSTIAVDGMMHCRSDALMLGHAEIIVAAPNYNFAVIIVSEMGHRVAAANPVKRCKLPILP